MPLTWRAQVMFLLTSQLASTDRHSALLCKDSWCYQTARCRFASLFVHFFVSYCSTQLLEAPSHRGRMVYILVLIELILQHLSVILHALNIPLEVRVCWLLRCNSCGIHVLICENGGRHFELVYWRFERSNLVWRSIGKFCRCRCLGELCFGDCKAGWKSRGRRINIHAC